MSLVARQKSPILPTHSHVHAHREHDILMTAEGYGPCPFAKVGCQ